MDNYQIADSFSLLAKLMDIHGENSFKSKSYASAAFAIEKLDVPISNLPVHKISAIKGIGTSCAEKIVELLETGKINILEKIILNTPPGVLEMLNIKGIGPKKINTIWKEMGIESIGELLYACKENRLKLYKGFGEKTQQQVTDTIAFYLKNKESLLYVQAGLIAPQTESFLIKIFGESKVFLTGKYKRQLEVLEALEFVIDSTAEQIENTLNGLEGFELKEKKGNSLIYHTSIGIRIQLYPTSSVSPLEKIIFTAASEPFEKSFKGQFSTIDFSGCKTEHEYFEKAGLAYIPAYLREDPEVIETAKKGVLPDVIQPAHIKGLIHCHSTWSDGSNTIEELARAAISKGMEYMVISDHSKSAFYAQGLSEEKIRAQHDYIDELNNSLKPFRIFKSIESDILNDGSLDYSNDVLSTFDLVIASVHSNLKMSEEKAMSRLLAAIENPYTTILGHMTGRLLLSRNGYPVDHRKIIEACARNKVVIELNANPNRLDIDWRYIRYALEQHVLISIDPDAHFIEGIDDILYGVLQAQKAMVTREQNLSSFSLQEFEKYINGIKSIKSM